MSNTWSKTQRLPGFGYVNLDHTSHENAVIAEGFAWVQTNPLRPEWIDGVTKDTTADDIAGLAPQVLNPHQHHSRNTHLIVEGSLTLRQVGDLSGNHDDDKKNMKKRPCRPKKLTISNNGTDPRFATVPAHVVYDGKPSDGKNCLFVEGHTCLSPSTALRFMNKGTLKWFDEDGEVLPDKDQEYVKRQLRTHYTVQYDNGGGGGGDDDDDDEDGDPNFVFRFRGRKPLAADMRAWFAEEWEDCDEIEEILVD